MFTTIKDNFRKIISKYNKLCHWSLYIVSESHKIKKIVHILYTKDFTRLIHRPNDYSAHRL